MKVTDYSVIIFRKDGSFTYETIKSTEGCGNVLLATHICTPEVNDLTDVNDFIAFKDILNSYMTICDDELINSVTNKDGWSVKLTIKDYLWGKQKMKRICLPLRILM